MRDDAALKAILTGRSEFALPLELVTTDRILQRWAVSIGCGLPSEEWDDIPKAKPSPLPDELAIIVDQAILRSPPLTRDLITRWYKTPQPTEIIAARLGISPRTVHRRHLLCLNHMKWTLESTKNQDLVAMIHRL